MGAQLPVGGHCLSPAVADCWPLWTAKQSIGPARLLGRQLSLIRAKRGRFFGHALVCCSCCQWAAVRLVLCSGRDLCCPKRRAQQWAAPHAPAPEGPQLRAHSGAMQNAKERPLLVPLAGWWR